jgi:anaerobic ribonucleoside-triphosphate reductase activating protein
VNGPGIRSVLWVQGCPLRCPGCFNPEFQPFEGGTLTPVADLVGRILADRETEGVTFSGGEPFAHAAPLAELAARLRAGGKGVLVFTGYDEEELRGSPNEDWRRLLDAADLLVAGRYERDKPVRHPLLASANQRLVHLTERYRETGFGGGPRVEFRISASGDIVTTGFPSSVPSL